MYCLICWKTIVIYDTWFVFNLWFGCILHSLMNILKLSDFELSVTVLIRTYQPNIYDYIYMIHYFKNCSHNSFILTFHITYFKTKNITSKEKEWITSIPYGGLNSYIVVWIYIGLVVPIFVLIFDSIMLIVDLCTVEWNIEHFPDCAIFSISEISQSKWYIFLVFLFNSITMYKPVECVKFFYQDFQRTVRK